MRCLCARAYKRPTQFRFTCVRTKEDDVTGNEDLLRAWSRLCPDAHCESIIAGVSVTDEVGLCLGAKGTLNAEAAAHLQVLVLPIQTRT